MKRIFYISAVLALIASVALLQDRAVGQTPAAKAKAAADPHGKMLTTYCVGCHNSRAKVGGLALDALDLKSPAKDADTWEKALRKLRGRLMPPPGAPQPSQSEIDEFSTWMETSLDANTKGRKAGYVPIQRLNRTEYAASVKALLGVDVNERDILPQDVQVEGFDNIAVALRTSPAFLEQYITAARLLAKEAVGNMNPPIALVTYQTGGNQDPALPFPPGLHGTMQFTHNFPADGEYRLSANFDDQSLGLYNRGLQNATTMVMMVDGKIVFKGAIGGAEDLRIANTKGPDGWQKILDRFQKIPVKLEAGPHTITAGFIDRSRVQSDENVGAGRGGGSANFPRGKDVIEIKGPYNPTGISNSISRPLIFVCNPKTIGEPACAKQIAENLAHRAYRRPVTEKDVAILMRFYEDGRLENGTFDQGVTQIVSAVLASPDFLYRKIHGDKVSQVASQLAKTNGEFPLSDLELATRLSFFIWNAPPDAELLKIAEAKQLTKPGAMDAQVKRMMTDPKASSLVSGFAMKWLNLSTLDSVVPDPMIFNGFNATLRGDFMKEAELFLGSILLNNRSVVDLLTSDQTFVNNRLARHYGIPGPRTSAFKPVTLTDPNRFGLLGKAAVLMRTSYGNRTSPVLRGAWVLDKLIGTPPSPPPATVVANLDQKEGDAPKTVRARLELHREAASCKQCHGVIDPTGLALENFDSIGQYRTADRQANNARIDASTVMANGVAINGPVELREQLVKSPDKFAEAMTEKLLMYAVNRPVEYFDMPQVRKVVRNAKKDNYTLTSLVMGIVDTDAFRKQGAAPVSKAVSAKAAPPSASAPKAAAPKAAAPAPAAAKGSSR